MSKKFLNAEISTYGETHGFVDLAAVAANFNHTHSRTNPYFGYEYEIVNGYSVYYSDDKGNEYHMGVIHSIIRDLVELIDGLNEKKEENIKMLQEMNDMMKFNRPTFDKLDSFLSLIDNVIEELDKEIQTPALRFSEKPTYSYEIIDKDGYEILAKYTNELVYYIPEVDKYVWSVPYIDISWTEVLTTIPIPKS